MGKLVIAAGGGGGGAKSDELSVTANDVIKGKTYIGADTDDEAGTGTLELTGTAIASNVLSTKTFYNTNAQSQQTGTMTNHGSWSPSVDRNSSITLPEGYYNGQGSVSGPVMTDVAAKTITPNENPQVAVGAGCYTTGEITVAGVSSSNVGSAIPRQPAKSVTPSETSQVVVHAGTYVTGDITVSAVSSSNVGSAVPRQPAKTVTPTESAQTAVSAGYYTEGAVTVAGIPTTYVGSGVPRQEGTTITPNSSVQTVTCSRKYMTSNVVVNPVPIGSTYGEALNVSKTIDVNSTLSEAYTTSISELYLENYSTVHYQIEIYGSWNKDGYSGTVTKGYYAMMLSKDEYGYNPIDVGLSYEHYGLNSPEKNPSIVFTLNLRRKPSTKTFDVWLQQPTSKIGTWTITKIIFRARIGGAA